MTDDWALNENDRRLGPQRNGHRSKRKAGRPGMRWKDNITKHAATKWMEKVEDRGVWRQMEEAYIQ